MTGTSIDGADPEGTDRPRGRQPAPELAPPGWRPLFLDYLHLGFTNATAFRPTDVMPLTHGAKYGLMIARAVNAFG